MMVAGMLLLAAGLGWLPSPAGRLLLGRRAARLLVAALGMSPGLHPLARHRDHSARPEEGGLASGIVNISYQVGSALGLAAMTAIAAGAGADELGDRLAHRRLLSGLRRCSRHRPRGGSSRCSNPAHAGCPAGLRAGPRARQGLSARPAIGPPRPAPRPWRAVAPTGTADTQPS